MFEKRKKVCYFTAEKIERIDITNTRLLTRFMTPEGKILPRRITGTSAKWQRRLTTAIKQARQFGLVPFKRSATD